MRAAAYSAFTLNAIQTGLAYRHTIWAGAFGDLVFIFARIAIWVSIYGAASSAAAFNAAQNSTALALSSPRVLLSQHCSVLPLSIASAMLTRFRSPPDTPLISSLPTLV